MNDHCYHGDRRSLAENVGIIFSGIYWRKFFTYKFYNYLTYNTLEIIKSYRFSRLSQRGVINLYIKKAQFHEFVYRELRLKTLRRPPSARLELHK